MPYQTYQAGNQARLDRLLPRVVRTIFQARKTFFSCKLT